MLEHSVKLNSLCVTVFLDWFGSFLETEMTFSKQHGQIPKPTCNFPQQNGISHCFHQISNALYMSQMFSTSLQMAMYK